MTVTGVLLSGMIGFFVLALGITMIFLAYQKKIISGELEQKKLENNYQKRLLQSAIDSQEAERKRIAHDLHDEIGALLTTSRLYFNQLSPGHAEEQLHLVSNKMNLLFDEMMVNIRRISHDLRPVVLENVGLMPALEGIRDRVMETGIDFNFTHGLSLHFTHEAELTLYRIIQELVSNTLKHAQASRIDLTMQRHGDELHVTYKDNGVGFTPSRKTSGLGLKSIESRLSLMEASLQTLNALQGVQFLLCINIKKLTDHE